MGGFCSQELESKKATNVNLPPGRVSEKERTFVVCRANINNRCVYTSCLCSVFLVGAAFEKKLAQQPLLIFNERGLAYREGDEGDLA